MLQFSTYCNKLNYVVCFFGVKSEYFLEFERRGGLLGEGTADIIRLIVPCTILNKGES